MSQENISGLTHTVILLNTVQLAASATFDSGIAPALDVSNFRRVIVRLIADQACIVKLFFSDDAVWAGTPDFTSASSVANTPFDLDQVTYGKFMHIQATNQSGSTATTTFRLAVYGEPL